jgi:CRP-like cAMP-binding protein
MVGSPLARPYLHFAYNYLEVVPLVIAFWDQGLRVYDQYLERAYPMLSEEDLVAATRRLHRMTVAPGTIIIRQGEHIERSYIVSKGVVALVHEDEGGRRWSSVLRPGQSFETTALGHARPRVVSARATLASELLVLDAKPSGG